ncbi:MAG: hypothetical protein HC822_22820 [Oscillochloris sp.]|nr:hypothetical protein [Oscillochloris sp.]
MTETQRERKIARRLVVTGTLRLLTPAHLGNGDAEAITDMPLLLDRTSKPARPFLAGTSIAGGLRGYLLAYEQGFGFAEAIRRKPTRCRPLLPNCCLAGSRATSMVSKVH